MTEENAYKIMLDEFKLTDNDLIKKIFHYGWFTSEQNAKVLFINPDKQLYTIDTAFNKMIEELKVIDSHNPFTVAIFNAAWKVSEENINIRLNSKK